MVVVWLPNISTTNYSSLSQQEDKNVNVQFFNDILLLLY